MKEGDGDKQEIWEVNRRSGRVTKSQTQLSDRTEPREILRRLEHELIIDFDTVSRARIQDNDIFLA